MSLAKQKEKSRLDELLVSLGYFDDLRHSQASIMTGKVLLNGEVCTKPGVRVKAEAEIAVRGVVLRYASRGGYKLEKALAVFPVNVKDRVVLDAGAASGGFTDCLLQHGAKRVYAVDVGFGQLRGRLAADSRVINWERTNISDLKIEDLDPAIDLCVADLSFLSLIKAVPILRALFRGQYEMICLVKPLFEHLPQHLKADQVAIRETLESFFVELLAQGVGVADVTSSPILGTRESVEFLVLLRLVQQEETPAELADKALQALIDDPPHRLTA